MEKVGGAFLLQELEPKKLLGSLVSVVPGSGLGWVHMSFFSDLKLIVLREHGGRTSLAVDRLTAVPLIGLLQISVVQNSVLRMREDGREEPLGSGIGRGTITVEGDPQARGMLVCSWSSSTAGVEHRIVGDHVELRIREDFANELVVQLIQRLARGAAGV